MWRSSKWIWLDRQKRKLWILKNVTQSFARRSAVEQYLWDVYHERKPPVAPGTAGKLALHLGVPTDKPITLKKRLEE